LRRKRSGSSGRAVAAARQRRGDGRQHSGIVSGARAAATAQRQSWRRLQLSGRKQGRAEVVMAAWHQRRQSETGGGSTAAAAQRWQKGGRAEAAERPQQGSVKEGSSVSAAAERWQRRSVCKSSLPARNSRTIAKLYMCKLAFIRSHLPVALSNFLLLPIFWDTHIGFAADADRIKNRKTVCQ
jgi:hypothetical protein